MDPFELIGTIFGVLSIVLTIRAHVACWPTGILSNLAYLVLFFQVKLYADAILQLFFIATSVLAWKLWVSGGEARTALPISTLSFRERVLTGGITAVAILCSAALFATFTDASLPYADSTIAGLSITAQLLLMRKKLESWVIWIAVDVLSIGVYFYKGIPLTGFLYCLFLVLATRGHFAWKKLHSGTGSSSESSGLPTPVTSISSAPPRSSASG